MPKVLLSFCIPTYNRPERVSNIINQILPFQSKEIEIVIGDDNPSNDRTQEVLKKIKDPRINYYRNKKNLGFDGNLLKTIKRANGEFVFLLMDDDDIEIKNIHWILKKIKENKNLAQLCGSIGDKRSGYNKIYFKFENKILHRGSESLKELLFYYPHGSGIVLRKSVLDFNKATKYIGFLYLQEALVAQAMIAGNTLCTSKIFAYIGEHEYKSEQPLFKGKPYGHPLSRLNQTKFKIKIIYDVTKKMKNIRNDLLNEQKRHIYYTLNYTLTKSLKDFLEMFNIVINIKEISKSPRFWLNLIYSIFSRFFKYSKFYNLCYHFFHN